MNKRHYGAVYAKNIVKECESCGEPVFVKSYNTHAVCSEWSCQVKKHRSEAQSSLKSSLRRYYRKKAIGKGVKRAAVQRNKP